MSLHLLALLLGTLFDRLVGDPDWLWRRLPHPVVWIGRAIGAAETRWNRAGLAEETRRRNGILFALGLALAALGIGIALEILFAALFGAYAVLARALVLGLFLAGNSLAVHVRAVMEALADEGLDGGRRAVSMIVGRDPEGLEEPGVCRAAIESLAENASDGYLAPWLFFLVAGLPGLLLYKAVNTADSMVGHMNARYRAFGWASARLDDLLNLAPARLTALVLAPAAALAGLPGRAAWTVARRDAGLHRSPNAGWPECAMAGALGLALGGPRRYADLVVDAPFLNVPGRRDAGAGDIAAALRVFARLCDLVALAALALLLVAPAGSG